jgi:hypothetical protein
MGPFTVYGTVTDGDGWPIAGATIIAVDVGLRRTQVLGKRKTDSGGDYEVRYAASKFTRAEKRTADILIRVCSAGEPSQVLGESSILFNAPPTAEINVQLKEPASTASELEQTAETVVPLLEGQGDEGRNLSLTAVTDADVNFIVADTGLARERVTALVAAAKLEEQTRSAAPESTKSLAPSKSRAASRNVVNSKNLTEPKERGTQIPAAAFYAWLRRGLPGDLDALFARTTVDLLADLDQAVAANLVPRNLASRREAIRIALGTLKAARALAPAASGMRPSLGDMLDTLPRKEALSPSEQLTFARLLDEHGDSDELWKRAESAGLGHAIPALRRTITLDRLTNRHAPLVRALQSRANAARPAATDFLVAIEPDEWTDLVYQHGAPPASGLDRDAYIDQLQADVERAFPTQLLSRHLDRRLARDTRFPTSKVRNFLEANPGLDLTATHVEPLLVAQGNTDEELREAMLQVQRIRGFTRGADETAQVVEAGFGSAAQIVHEGPAALAQRAPALTTERVDAIRKAAQGVVTASMLLAVNQNLAAVTATIAGMPAAKRISDSVARDYPSLRTLFGDLDYCECRHCRSVLGPAAYLTDIMHFLQRSPLQAMGALSLPNLEAHVDAALEFAAGGTVLGALLMRRPDFADLELSCENTDREIPYIDLVLEILENAAGLPYIVPPAAYANVDIAAALANRTIPQDVRDALAQTDITIGANFTISEYPVSAALGAQGVGWVIKDGSRRWTLWYLRPQLIYSIAGASGPYVPGPPLTDVQGAVAALDRGAFSTELADNVSAGLPFVGAPTITKSVGTSTSFQQLWLARYQRGVAVRIDAATGRVEVFAIRSGPRPLRTYQFSAAMASVIASSFTNNASGKLKSRVAQRLALPVNETYLQVFNTGENWWELTVEGSAWLAFIGLFTVAALSYQNSSLVGDLKAAPENRNPAAYTKLRAAKYPWTLPFDLWALETRAFLDALGVSRALLIDSARPQTRLTSEAAILERLGLWKAQADLITAAAPADPWTYWGLSQQNNRIADHVAGSERTGDWDAILANLSMLLQQSALSYREYLGFRQTSFAGNAVGVLTPPNECKTSNITLQLSRQQLRSHLDRVHVFTRLWRGLQWNMRELDAALEAFGGSTADPMLADLAMLARLRTATELPLSALTACVDELGTRPWIDYLTEGTPIVPSAYDAVFQRAALRRADGFEQLAAANLSGSPISARLDLVAASIDVKPNDVDKWLNGAANLAIDDELTIENLSRLYAAASVCRALRITPTALPEVIELLDVDPDLFATLTAPPTRAERSRLRAGALFELAERVAAVRAAQFDLETLSYLQRNERLSGTAPGAAAQAERRFAQILSSLRTSLQAGRVLADVSSDNLRRQLALRGLYQALSDAAVGIDGLAYEPGASVEIALPLAAPATIPLALRSQFTFVEIDATRGVLRCRGTLAAADFIDLRNRNLFPVARVTALEAAYSASVQAHADAIARFLQILALDSLPRTQVAINVTTAPTIPAALADRLSFDAPSQLTLTGWLTNDEKKAFTDLNSTLQTQIDTLQAQAETAIPAASAATRTAALDLVREPDVTARIRAVLLRLVPYLERDLLTRQLAGAVNLDETVVTLLLTRATIGGQTLLTVFTDAAFLRANRAITPARGTSSQQFAALDLLDEIATLSARFRIRPEHWSWIVDSNFSMLDLLALPTALANTPVAFDDWRRFADLMRLRDVLDDGPARLARIETALGNPGFAVAIQAEFAEAFGLPPGEVAEACGANLLAFSAAPSGGYANPSRLLALAQLLHIMRSMGTTATAIESLIGVSPNLAVATLARAIFAANIDTAVLPERLRAISNRLRNAQRDALVAYLVQRDRLADVDALFDRYLIDVQMGSCMTTSRIKQAISSVQLFVQRCLLNLEGQGTSGATRVSPDSIDARRWGWMKFYRVWEANRKIFLYPENWLDVSLLPGQSTQLRALAGDLAQTELTQDTATEAFLRFLERLAQVAHLTVISMAQEPGADGRRTVHIVARTEGEPRRYYYRTWHIAAEGSMWWGAWEEIQLSLITEHVEVLSHRGATFIAWLRTSAVVETKVWQTELNLAQRNGDGWELVSKSGPAFTYPMLAGKDEKTTFALRDASTTTQLALSCWGAEEFPDPSLSIRPTALFIESSTRRTGQASVNISIHGTVLQQSLTTPTRYRAVPGAAVEVLFDGGRQAMSLTDANGNYTVGLAVTHAILPNARVTIRATTVDPVQSGVGIHFLVTEQPLAVDDSLGDLYAIRYSGDLVVSPPRDFPQPPPSDPERALRMRLLGYLSWKRGDAIVFLPDTSANATLPVGSEVESYSSGLREKAVRQSDALVVPNSSTALALASPGRFFVVADQEYAAYRDDEKQMYVVRDASGKTSVLQDGSDFVANLVADLAQSSIEVAFSNNDAALPVPVGLDPTKLTQDSQLERAVNYARRSPWGDFNWEIRHHAVMLVATQFTRAQRFPEAQRWLHLIFDPTRDAVGGAERFWRFPPFGDDQGPPIEELLTELAQGTITLRDEIDEWAENPFQPHLVARQRIRSYKLAVVLKYVENLIAWGDQQFRRDTIESINEATQLYVLAARLLGKRPAASPKSLEVPPKSYRDIQNRLDAFSNAWIPWEGPLATSNVTGSLASSLPREVDPEVLFSLGSLYFCIPGNDKLGDYWDTVADRLFKIRHCMNVEGVERQLPLFEPPIDPALLVRATALGLDLASVLQELDVPAPLYRYNVLLQKALEIGADVRTLGSELLAALEKNDAERLAQLRAVHELQLLKAAGTIRDQQKQEADANLAALRTTRAVTVQRYLNFQRLMGNLTVVAPAEGALVTLESSTLPLNPPQAGDADLQGLALLANETIHMGQLKQSNDFGQAAGTSSTLAGVFHTMPDISVAVSLFGLVSASTIMGGSHLGAAASAVASGLDTAARNSAFQGARSETIAGYQRRFDEWRWQSNSAARELAQIDAQIVAMTIRAKIAAAELEQHDKQIAQAEEMDEFLRDKYTNAELYTWMGGQLSEVYFRMYQLAHAMAKRAERAMRLELGLTNSAFIDYGYWDSLKKGLLAGEHLLLALKRLDTAYLEQNRRELEIVKHVSMLSLDPRALVELRQNGKCELEIPEAVYDLDFPGHFMRRIKSLSVTIPCVAGPYTGVNCTLTLLKSSIRRVASAAGGYRRDDGTEPDARFSDDFRALEAVVASSAQNDSGLFETNLRDERYLPFESAGAISRWRLELPEFHAFDYNTIADVILHVRYTARDGGGELRQASTNELMAALNAIEHESALNGLMRLISVRQEFPNEWRRLLATAGTAADRGQPLAIAKSRFPFLLQRVDLEIRRIDIMVAPAAGAALEALPDLSITMPDGTGAELVNSGPIGPLLVRTAECTVGVAELDDDARWTLTLGSSAAAVAQFREQVADVLLLCHYRVKPRATP